MDGVLNILKPAGMTSFDVIGYLRRVTGQKKIGHTGTLDPSAVGVLPVCIGSATKAIEFMIDKDKIYRAELTLGIATDTQDSSGQMLYSHPVDVTEDEIKSAVAGFEGVIEQLPPMYSAIKIGGKKLYELARQGETIERETRKVTIFKIGVNRIWTEAVVFEKDGKSVEYKIKKVLMDVHCSKGTYIRTLCSDIGEKLGCGGHMSFLVRTQAGKYGLDSALTMEEIEGLAGTNSLEKNLMPVEQVFEDYDFIYLSKEEEFKYVNGVRLEVNKNNVNISLYRVYDNSRSFLGIGEIYSLGDAAYLKSKKFFNR